jgi:ubiquinone/menaquinone biosynthesis C-methylase UbiE
MKIEKHNKQFGNLALDYTKYRKPYPKELFEFFFSLLKEEKNLVLDIACGTGKSTESLMSENTEVFGCDHDELMIEEAKSQAEKKNLKIDYKIAEVENLPYKDDEFDVVVVGTAFHWFVNEKSISEIKRVLKNGGLFFIFWTLTVKDVPEEDSIPSEFFNQFNWEKVPAQLRNLDYISKFLKNCGLKEVSTHRIPVVTEYNVEEYVGLMKTASSFGVLSDKNKEKFIRELKELLTKKLGSRSHFTLEDEIQVCYGFKE